MITSVERGGHPEDSALPQGVLPPFSILHCGPYDSRALFTVSVSEEDEEVACSGSYVVVFTGAEALATHEARATM